MRILLLTVAATSCLVATAIAQVQTPTLQITAPAAPSLTSPSTSDSRERAALTPGGATVVAADEFRDGRAKTLADMVGFVPGVLPRTQFGQEDARVSIRGSALARQNHMRGLRLMLDGVPLNLADGSGDTMEIDPLTIDHLEIYKGANALRFGSPFLGGAINLVSPTGRDYPAFLSRAEAGSWDTQRFQLGSGGVVGHWDYFVSPTWQSTDGYRDHTDAVYRRLSSNLGYRRDSATETRLYFNYANIDQRIPSNLSKADALEKPKATSADRIANHHQRNIESQRLAAKTGFLSGDTEVTLGTYYQHKYLFHPIFQVIDHDYDGYGLFGSTSTEGRLYGDRNRLIAGFHLAEGVNKNKRFVNSGGRKGAPTLDQRDQSDNVEVYAEDSHYVRPDTALVGGLQLSRAGRRTRDYILGDGDDTASRTYWGFNPKIGAIHDIDKATQLFFNLSRSFEPPDFSDLNPTTTPGFNTLDPQTAVTLELGTRGRRDDYAWDVSIYRAWLKDEFQVFLQPDGSTLTRNADTTIHQGLELGAEWTMARGLWTSAGERDSLTWRNAYTYSDFRFDKDKLYTNNRLPGAPEHVYRGELRYRQPSGWWLAPNAEWVPKSYFIDNANTQDTKPYAIFGVKIGWDVDPNLKVFADARNVTNEKYINTVGTVPLATTANNSVYSPGEGRAIYVGIEYRW